ncbi:hypothetical protein [Sulfurimonas sp. NW9]|uniref:hypothetical protein n=1 Tax=Sulfurimonas sp. NW9 TaxID=2922728 RepID=UPI003DA9408B
MIDYDTFIDYFFKPELVCPPSKSHLLPYSNLSWFKSLFSEFYRDVYENKDSYPMDYYREVLKPVVDMHVYIDSDSDNFYFSGGYLVFSVNKTYDSFHKPVWLVQLGYITIGSFGNELLDISDSDFSDMVNQFLSLDLNSQLSGLEYYASSNGITYYLSVGKGYGYDNSILYKFYIYFDCCSFLSGYKSIYQILGGV